MEDAVRKFACLLVATLLIGFGCGGSGGGGGGGGGNLATPQKPVANAGTPQTVPVNVLVQLDGSGSHSPNGGLLTYQWTLFSRPGGSASALNNGTVANPTFLPDTVGSYVLHLVVNDGVSDSAISDVTITAQAGNIAPVADAGPDQNVVTGATVTLDGSGSHDANGDTITYSWTIITKPAVSASTLNNGTVANPTFIADKAGSYVLRLVVNDGVYNSDFSEVTITAVAGNVNVAPVADAGPNQKVVTGATVTLDGSDSHDPNPGDFLTTYSWSMISKPPGSFATLWTPFAVQTTFTADKSGSYVFALVVTDNGSATSNPSIVTISADKLVSISVTPLDCVTTLGFSVQYSALGTYEIASQKVMTDIVTWTSDNTLVATIDHTGFSRTWSEGVTVIRASYAGVPPFSTTLRVGQVQLQSLEITNPSPVTLKVRQTESLTLRGHYSDGTSVDLTKLADWSVSFGGISVLTVGNGGLHDDKGFVSAFGIGTAEVHATYQGKDAKVTVNVTL